ncbi:hypothetical protein ACFX14_019373 [Malus domestica]
MATPKGNDTKDGQEENAEEKKRTRTLVKNIRTRDDRKAHVLLEFDYVLVQRNPKKKAKCIYVKKPMVETQKKKPMVETQKNKKVLDKENVKPIVDKTKEKPKVVKAKPIAKETKKEACKWLKD